MKSKVIKITIVVVILLLLLSIFKNIFSSSDYSRTDKKHTLSNNEKNSVKSKLEEIENVDSIKIYKNIKIIKIVINLSSDTDFEQVKKISNEAIESFSEKNLKYFDIEIYVDSENEDSEIYPQIGYKHKKNQEFSW